MDDMIIKLLVLRLDMELRAWQIEMLEHKVGLMRKLILALISIVVFLILVLMITK